jgi:signal transduction histidine kinase
VKINYSPRRDCIVRAGDPLRDVFDNLVDNAIRHSTRPITLDLSVDRMILEGHGITELSSPIMGLASLMI